MTLSGNVKRIVCLANSRKMSGRCIAGKEILADGSSGSWVRPVSARPAEEVSEYERQYEDGRDPRVLDLIDVPVLRPTPKDYQQENWLIDNQRYWINAGRIVPNDIGQWTDSVSTLWLNGNSSYNGLNDRVSLESARGLRDSLKLIQVSNLSLSVSAPGANFGNYRRSVQGRFQYNGVDYWLRVTDPVYERRYLQENDGIYPIGERFLTISLGEPFQGHSYKLIAAIIPA